jgi:hypothetical protein
MSSKEALPYLCGKKNQRGRAVKQIETESGSTTLTGTVHISPGHRYDIRDAVLSRQQPCRLTAADGMKSMHNMRRKAPDLPGKRFCRAGIQRENGSGTAQLLQLLLNATDSDGISSGGMQIIWGKQCDPHQTSGDLQTVSSHATVGHSLKGCHMKITILGSGTSTGIPMVGCHCQVCSSTDPRNKRTRTSLLVENDGAYILVDTSTDLRSQAIRENIPKIDAVLFTHDHADHIHGIDDLRGFHFQHKNIIPCYATQETLASIDSKFS